MAQVINTNSLSLMTQNNMNASQSSLNTAIQRLSSGLRINSAKDDAAGQAIANRFTANIKGLTQAQRNANDGISLAQTTEGALTEVNNNLQRVRELSVQAANGSNSASDLKSIQDEIAQRLSEIDRTSQQTDFNGVKVLSSSAKPLTIQVGANDGETITIDLKQIDSSTLGLTGFTVSKNSLNVSDAITTVAAGGAAAAVDVDLSGAATTLGVNAGDLSLHNVSGTGDYVVKSGNDYYAASVDTATGNVQLNTVDITVADAANGNAAGSAVTDMLVKVGADATGTATGYITVQNKNYAVANTALADGGAGGTLNDAQTGTTINLSQNGGTAATAEFTGVSTANPLAKLDAALKVVDDLRSSLGAVQNRFDSTISNLGTTITNLSSSRSRIQDADYATEVSNMTRAQILQQAGTSVLSQANQTTQSVLSLLR
ncbi:FliC/FljB family flagellin [Cupriavidus consociatus]|uniref:FliC/FljB family flagellin n=1 Tax=Cupriavidus consociatus TaxID=2821357 RepID=UPI001AEB140E|nr:MULTISPECIES: FliC/FljB family flagellin [unclassified Cupriavidus]MBP0619894.1 FliC/FljB family flagellin [Cupriavidus sp. LEh25]MDK2656549.1 FliC/FljB family flagellin [Cupriavidus sp. LEh21]